MKLQILSALHKTDGFISGEELCQSFGVSRTAIWKAMQKLKAEGYKIESVPNKGYRLAEAADVLSAEELKSIRKTAWVGEEIIYYDMTDSTNTQAKHLAENGAVHGTLVVAGAQNAGRGRRGRTWESPADSAIFMSLLLRPQIKPQDASMLTLVAAMAVAKAVHQTVGIEVKIKWPNDIVLNGKKICGILTEMSSEIDAINYVVIGIGMNVSNRNFPKEIAKTATSIALEGTSNVNRAQLTEAVWEQFEVYYDKFVKKSDLSDIMEEYQEYLANLNKQVRVLDPKGDFSGVARGITTKGELVVESEGAMHLVSSGEVSVRGIYGYV